MRYIWQHTQAILSAYHGNIPLGHFLKNYFRQYPILGSRDRRYIEALVYSWYRCSRGINQDNWLEKLAQHWINEPKAFSEFILSHWLVDHGIIVDLNTLFPFETELSGGINKADWLQSMLVQPNLFIRIRNDNQQRITGILDNHNIPFKFITETCLSLPNRAKIDALLPADAYVVQDASSQATSLYFSPHKGEHWYDCCCGAGGKSLVLKDMEPGIRLTVSDVRESIIHNLQRRFRQYHHQFPKTYVLDASDQAKTEAVIGSQLFDNIICDAPCSGSGTWARTPEQLYYFDVATLAAFSRRQKDIAINVSRHLQPGGRLIYITCSVFNKENEEVIADVVTQTGLTLTESKLINGTPINADSMFVAVLRR